MSTKNVDWSEAPEGATHWGPDTEEWSRSWRIVQGEQMAVMLDDGEDTEWTWYPITDEHRENLFPTLVARPAAWSGEGLPPVGWICEMLSHGEEESEWIEVQILAHTKINGEAHAVFQYEEHVGTGSVQGSCFRPVRTAQERGVDLVLSEIEALYAEGGPAAIYDAGYRKVDQPGAQP